MPTFKPLASRIAPRDAEVTPFPRAETTPPVTKIKSDIPGFKTFLFIY